MKQILRTPPSFTFISEYRKLPTQNENIYGDDNLLLYYLLRFGALVNFVIKVLTSFSGIDDIFNKAICFTCYCFYSSLFYVIFRLDLFLIYFLLG